MSKNEEAQETSKLITELFNLPNESIKGKLKREIGDVLKAGNLEAQKVKIIDLLLNIFSEGICIELISQNKAKWGALNNRRGQIGENKTMAAVTQVLENFQGISVMGMKTHTYLVNFLESMNINLTYRNDLDPVTKKVRKTNEVEHDHISTWIEEDALVVAMIESKTREIKISGSKENQESKTQAAIKHAKDALKQVLKDFKCFKEIFPDISEEIMSKIR